MLTHAPFNKPSGRLLGYNQKSNLYWYQSRERDRLAGSRRYKWFLPRLPPPLALTAGGSDSPSQGSVKHRRDPILTFSRKTGFDIRLAFHPDMREEATFSFLTWVRAGLDQQTPGLAAAESAALSAALDYSFHHASFLSLLFLRRLEHVESCPVHVSSHLSALNKQLLSVWRKACINCMRNIHLFVQNPLML